MKICFQFSKVEEEYLLTKKFSKLEIKKLTDGFDIESKSEIKLYFDELNKLIGAY